MLGHITTFGGHPVIAAAGVATVKFILEQNLLQECLRKEQLIRARLQHEKILEIRGKGLMLTAILKDETLTPKVVKSCMDKGLILFFLLFEKRALRITPPLTITDEEIHKGCDLLLEVLDRL